MLGSLETCSMFINEKVAISNKPGPMLKIHGFGANGKGGFDLAWSLGLIIMQGRLCIDREGLERRRTGTRQVLPVIMVIRALKSCTAGLLPWFVFISFEKSLDVES